MAEGETWHWGVGTRVGYNDSLRTIQKEKGQRQIERQNRGAKTYV
jgi:hypothetical protein